MTTVPSVRSIHLEAFPQLAEARSRSSSTDETFLPLLETRRQPVPGEPIKILVAGNLDLHKGKAFLSALKAADQADRLEFHFIGRSDPFTEALGVSHGPYERAAFPEIVEPHQPDRSPASSRSPPSRTHTP